MVAVILKSASVFDKITRNNIIKDLKNIIYLKLQIFW